MTTPPKIYTLDEGAAYLRISKHGLGKVARRLGIGSKFGRNLRFTEEDLQAIWKAQRLQPRDNRAMDHGPLLSVQELDIQRRAEELLARRTKRSRP